MFHPVDQLIQCGPIDINGLPTLGAELISAVDSDDGVRDSLKTVDIVLMIGQDLALFKYPCDFRVTLKTAVAGNYASGKKQGR